MSHTVHLGDRSPVTITDWSGPKPTTRTFEAGEDGTVEVRTRADLDLLLGSVPGATDVTPEPETETPPSTPSGRGRGRNQP